MARDVKFLKGVASAYQGLAVKDVNTFYFTTDDKQLYLGEIKLSSAEDLAAALTRLTEVEGKATANETNINSQATEITNIKETLKALTGDSGEGSEGGTIANMIDNAVSTALGEIPEGKTVQEYIVELTQDAVYDDTAIKARITANETAISTLNGEVTVEGSVKKQVSDAVAAIVAEAPEAYDTLKEISDWISTHSDSAATMNSKITANETVINNLKTLVGELPEGLDAEINTIVKYIDSKVAGVKDWTSDIATAKSEAIAEATTKANTAEANAKTYADGLASNYATAAQGAKADSAVQTVAEGATNGTIKVDGTDVSVHGLGSAAYTDAAAYDLAGSATSALNSAKAYTDEALTWGTISSEVGE